MAYARSNRLAESQIPLVDMGPLRDNSDPRAVGRAIRQASSEMGFLYVYNHGIPDGVFETARSAGYEFFRRPLSEKLKVQIKSDHRGYLQIGHSKMEEDRLPDLKESFVWGHELPEDGCGDHPLRGMNQWPEDPPGLRPAVTPFFDGAHVVARHLLRGFALSLELPEDAFLSGMERPMSRASLTYYPPQASGLGEDHFGVAPHTDFGVLTVLCQDDVGGLQVETPAGEWVEAPPIPGTLVINVGDLLTRWTNGICRSAPHRVIDTSGRERLSLVLGYDPDHDTIIDPGLACGPSEAPRNTPISCGDYLIWRMQKSFVYQDSRTA